jgi:hypothetical protein
MSDIKPINVLLSRFAAIPRHIAQTIEGRSEEELRAKPSQDEWSMVNIFAHMRASDAIVTPRIYAILVRDTPPLIAYDERRWAEIARYEHLAFRSSLHLFTMCRIELINMLSLLASDDWQRVGIHEELGPQTVWGIVTGLLKHEEEHCAQLTALIQR